MKKAWGRAGILWMLVVAMGVALSGMSGKKSN